MAMHAVGGSGSTGQASPSDMAIDDIPLDQRRDICIMIDYSAHERNGYWESLVNELGFTERDSKNFLLAFAKGQSPTENLLRECSFRNYRVSTLSHVLKKVGLVKLAENLMDDLGEKFSGSLTEKSGQSNGSNNSLPLSDSDKIGGLDTIHYPYEDIKKGTDNFSLDMKLGAGAFGKVYKVKLKNTIFACKVLTINNSSPHFSIISKHSKQSDLRNELRFLAEYRHPNIIPLYGWSLDGKDPCLIYQYMAKGSLQDCLQRQSGNEPLTWPQRIRIACDAATGLQFLHTIKEKPLIHGDIKTANILLDEAFGAKLGDFGLAREGPQKSDTKSYFKLNDEHTPGTMGYLAYEYMKCKKLSVQVDTYAFGVVLLELYTGRRAFYRTKKNESPILLRDFMDKIATDNEGGPEEADNQLYDTQSRETPSLPKETALKFVHLALECCHEKRNKRPTMSNVLERLEALRENILEIMSNSDKGQNSGSSSDSINMNQIFDQRDWMPMHHSRTPVESVDTSIIPRNMNEHVNRNEPPSHFGQNIPNDFSRMKISENPYNPYSHNGQFYHMSADMSGNPFVTPFMNNPQWIPNTRPPVNHFPLQSMPWNWQVNGFQYPGIPHNMQMSPYQMPCYQPSSFPEQNMPNLSSNIPFPGGYDLSKPSHFDSIDTKSGNAAPAPVSPSSPGDFSSPGYFSSSEYEGACGGQSTRPASFGLDGFPSSNPFFSAAAVSPSHPFAGLPDTLSGSHDVSPSGENVKVNKVKAKMMECIIKADEDTDVSEILEESFKPKETGKL